MKRIFAIALLLIMLMPGCGGGSTAEADLAGEPPVHFTDETDLINWYIPFYEQRRDEIVGQIEMDPAVAAMYVQTQAIADGRLVSVECWETYILPMAFTAHHTYVLLGANGSPGIMRVDNSLGWRVSDSIYWERVYPKEI